MGDAAIAVADESAVSVLASAGLGLTVGGAGGTVLHVAERGLGRLPVGLVRAGLPSIAGALGLWVAGRLGAFARLDGPYRGLALAALVVGGLGAAGIGLFAAGMFAPRGPVQPGPRRAAARAVFAGALIVGVAALVLADRRLFVARYLIAHDALGVAAWWFLACAVRVACPPATGAVRALMLVAIIGFVGLSLGVLDADHQDALRARFLAVGARSWMVRALRVATDLDRDGYSSRFGGGDCAPWRGAVHPGAPEIPGNGVDDNCLLGDGRKLEPRLSPDMVRPTSRSPVNVVLITIDTLRFDRTSLTRTDRDITPALRAWARGALVFDRAYTAGASTALAIPALLRGLYPRRLHWTELVETTSDLLISVEDAARLPTTQLRARHGLPIADPSWPLPRWLAWRGMRTGAVVDDGRIAEILDRRYVGDGFDTFVDADHLSRPSNDDASTVTAAIALLQRQRASGAPFFTWVHLFGLHGPNPARPDIPRLTDDAMGEYDQALAYLDRQLARLLEALGPLREDTVIILTSDHGERMVGKDRFHGHNLHEPMIRVPLIIQAPRGRTGTDHTLVSTIDLVPTLLGFTRTPTPRDLDGVDLSALVQSGQPIAARLLLADAWLLGSTGERFKDLAAAFDGERKYVIDVRQQTSMLVDQADTSYSPPNLVDREAPGALRDHVRRYLEDTSGLAAGPR